ncbi:uncharacterized protein EV420DRAFT_1476666 [Desarmillaria tabescens]|uniref:Uncharacterized protein n=1 Tax=Armillaria tabescens TaxID=1929756 RepID=A0AA39NC22_ARMTA|nr:uncharacterized protein EV420DRAFT_1476666 [Desarmillaria tabescens]KAK0462880.1 hypothetical protein EV420DRAFT_1476666 [Desarmillaria tabescens]
MAPTNMSALQQFHEYWWGTKDNFLDANTVIHLPAFSNFHIFAFTDSRLLVLKEYIYIFERLQRFCQTPNCYSRGIVLDGHSGIGKSMFLFYALIRCLQESRDVIFHFYCRTLMFSKDGVQDIGLNDFQYNSIDSPTWCLIDSYGGEEPPLPLTSFAYILPILASSRSEQAHSGWAKDRAELLSQDQATLVLYQSLLPKALNFCGPIIRDIQSYLLSQGATTIIDHKYGPHPRVSNPASLLWVLTTFHCSTWVNIDKPCSAALMFRRPAAYAGGTDEVYFDFRSPRLAQEVWDQLIHLEYEDALSYFSRFSFHPDQTVACRWLFQVIARKQICRGTTQSKPLALLQEMDLAEGTRTFIDTGVHIPYQCLPVNGVKRTPVFYSFATEILCNTTSFYIPRKITQDFMFDGLFFGHDPLTDFPYRTMTTPDPTVLYILRTTTEAEDRSLVPIYLLVVPLQAPSITFLCFPSDDPRCKWTMPQSWFQKGPGRVFCQTIEIN